MAKKNADPFLQTTFSKYIEENLREIVENVTEKASEECPSDAVAFIVSCLEKDGGKAGFLADTDFKAQPTRETQLVKPISESHSGMFSGQSPHDPELKAKLEQAQSDLNIFKKVQSHAVAIWLSAYIPISPRLRKQNCCGCKQTVTKQRRNATSCKNIYKHYALAIKMFRGC